MAAIKASASDGGDRREERDRRKEAERDARRREREGAGCDRLGDEVRRHLPVPGNPVRNRCRSRAARPGRAGHAAPLARSPSEAALRPSALRPTSIGPRQSSRPLSRDLRPELRRLLRGERRQERGLFRLDVEELGACSLLGLADADADSSREAREISEAGSSRSPAMIAWTGQTTTHAGSSPTSVRWAQKWHLAAVPDSGSMWIAS